MTYVLAIDQGTTGSTCLMVAPDGRIGGRGYREITQHFPRPGWVEHDATEILERTLAAARDAVAQAGEPPAAIGITNQRETVVVWERATGTPVARAIVWQDRRTSARCLELAPMAPRLAELTGLVVDPYFSATKLEWLLREHRLGHRASAGELAAGTIDCWLIWNLTGGAVHATDPTNASRTQLYDIGAMAWSDELCALFGVPRAMLPEVRPSSGDFGTTRAELFGRPVPIAGVAGDQQAALFGQGCWERGDAKCTYGTGAFLLLNTGRDRPTPGGGLLTTIGCDARGQPAYALEAAIFIAGAAVQWLRDGLQIIGTAAETEPLARSVESTGGVYFVPALVGLGAPHWAPEARGTIVGLTRGTTRAHLARAALEAMAYSTLDVLEAMREHGGASELARALRVDGGATANDWLMQFQADVLGLPVERPEMVETTALGAAGLAGLATGVWPTPQAFLASRRASRFQPGSGAADAREGVEGWHRAIGATLAWARGSGTGAVGREVRGSGVQASGTTAGGARVSGRTPRRTLRWLDAHADALSACRRCDLGDGSVVPIISKPRAPVAMLIGQAPGQTETVDQRPFAGRAGKTLFRWLERAGLDEARARDVLYIAAITRCYPGPSPSGRGDRVPSVRERTLCADWLDRELIALRPPLVIPVGRLAIERMIGACALEDVVGKEVPVEHPGGWSIAVALPHPSGASSWIHQGNHPELLGRALELLRRRLAALGAGRSAEGAA